MKINYVSKLMIVFTVIILSGCENSTPEVITKESVRAEVKEEETGTAYGDDIVYVYVTGAVQNPDVYKVEKECRIYQVIDMAGGFSHDADTSAINMADKVYDGMKIVVYKKGEATIAGDHNGVTENTSGKVNINTASKELLMTLPGIGEAKAESIIKYREENGGFKNIQDIMNISGIKEGAFQKIKDLITV